MEFEFRSILPEEWTEAADIEQTCFPPNEACSRERMKERVQHVPELFLVAVDKAAGRIAGFINGLATNEEVFRDDFFLDTGLNNLDGKNIMILGLNVLPQYRRQGLARRIVEEYARRERERGRRRLVLTCLESKVAMYEKMGFNDLGIADSEWGGEAWHEMDRKLAPLRTVRVAAAVICDSLDAKRKIYATERGYGEYAGWWEFPGGKIEAGETPEQALAREISEELAVEIKVGSFIDRLEYDYPTFHLSMDCFWCEVVSGELTLLEASSARWLSGGELDELKWLPADITLIDKLKKEIISLD